MFVSTARRSIVRDWIFGVPDLVIEVVSPERVERDRIVKRRLYAENRVPEFWLVDPEERTVEVLRASEAGWYRVADAISSPTLPGLFLPVGEIFAQEGAAVPQAKHFAWNFERGQPHSAQTRRAHLGSRRERSMPRSRSGSFSASACPEAAFDGPLGRPTATGGNSEASGISRGMRCPARAWVRHSLARTNLNSSAPFRTVRLGLTVGFRRFLAPRYFIFTSYASSTSPSLR